MPTVQGFRGVRYDLGHVGSLSDVVAPPYDVIDKEFQDQLYKQHPANVIRLILNREEPGDDSQTNRYTRAAKFLKRWRSEKLMMEEPEPAVYVYHQLFDYDGVTFNRRGFMARVKLEPFGEGKIYPHEETHSAAKADRLNLINACQANLSQIFGIYPDSQNEAQELLEKEIVGVAPLEATDHLGVVHRMWPVTNAKVISELAGVMEPKPMYVADGHHRYETACNYRQQLADAGQLTEAADYVLTMCVSMDDPGMIVLPTHRLFRGVPPHDSATIISKLDGLFETEVVDGGVSQAQEIWSTIENEDEQGTIGLYAPVDKKWVVARVTTEGLAKIAELAADRSDDWQGLGVSLLHRLLVENALGLTDLPKPKYVHLVSEVVDAIDADSDSEFGLAALVMPATLDHIRAISEHGERMPAKSTYFYPKLLSGMVINPLDGA